MCVSTRGPYELQNMWYVLVWYALCRLLAILPDKVISVVIPIVHAREHMIQIVLW